MISKNYRLYNIKYILFTLSQYSIFNISVIIIYYIYNKLIYIIKKYKNL